MRFPTVAILFAVSVLSACAADSQFASLTNVERAIYLPDLSVRPDAPPVPYDMKEDSDVSVGMYICSEPGFMNLTKVSVIIRSKLDRTIEVSPHIALFDVNGIELPAYTLNAFIAEASALAETPEIPLPRAAPSRSSKIVSKGKITETTTGQTYVYQGQSTSSSSDDKPVDPYLRMVAMSEAIDSSQRRTFGQSVMRWGHAFWLQQSYSIAPQAAVSGGIMYPVVLDKSRLPAKVIVTVNDSRFEFATIAK